MIRDALRPSSRPKNATGKVHLRGLAGLVDLHLHEGGGALLVAAPPGESASLDFDEHSSLIRRVVERVQGEIPVFAGSSGCIAAISRE